MTSEVAQAVSGFPLGDSHPIVSEMVDSEELKDYKTGFIYADLMFALLSSGTEPANGWTMYKLHKQAYKRYKLLTGGEVAEQGRFKRFWNRETLRFDKKEKLGDEPLLELMKQIQEYLKANPKTLDILHPNKETIWSCQPWLFPQRVHDKFTANSEEAKANGNAKNAECSFQGAPLIVANTPLPQHMGELWKKCGKKFCADGGANRVYDWHLDQKHDPNGKDYYPHYLVGDMDSCLREVRVMFAAGGTEIVGCSGQDDTDLEKTLNLVDTLDLPSNSIVITGCNGGNIGQELANYHACWKHSHRQIALISEAGVVMYLAPGRHRIHAAADFKCSILPLGEPCASITTTGLKWNLDDDIIQFGGLISSSNMTLTSEITVENSHPVIWTFDCAP